MWPRRKRSCPKCKARSPRRDFNKRLEGTRMEALDTVVEIYALRCPLCGHAFTESTSVGVGSTLGPGIG